MVDMVIVQEGQRRVYEIKGMLSRIHLVPKVCVNWMFCYVGKEFLEGHNLL
jgi:hypothetical protein